MTVRLALLPSLYLLMTHEASGGGTWSGSFAPGSLGEETWVTVAELSVGYTPRQVPLDEEHVLSLIEVIDRVPPILVDKDTLALIDGAHRVEAARRAGLTSIRAIQFSGDPLEAMVLAVQANVRHGKPLSRAERKAAAAILQRSPDRSDRWVAEVCGVSHTTVGGIRRAAMVQDNVSRTGRDGRARPVDPSSGRMAVAKLLSDSPDQSLRRTARLAGVSHTTAQRVAARLSATPPRVGGHLPKPLPRASPSGDLPPPPIDRDWWNRTTVTAAELNARLGNVPLGRLHEAATRGRGRVQAQSRGMGGHSEHP